MNKLIEKYDKPGPRYTSYPPVPFWKSAPSESEWIGHLNERLEGHHKADLYIHIPFCQTLCWYCGCNRVINKNQDVGEQYVDYLLKEWEIYLAKLNTFEVASLHFGGGTPNFLKAEYLEKLLSKMAETFVKENFIGSVEIDPRTVTQEQLDIFKKYGFSRISMGIQDFDEGVQKAINRIQPFEKVKEVTEWVRERSFESLNFDLIFGLPKQTNETIKDTIEKTKELSPDLIAFYSYAHLPDRIKNQKLIKEDELLQGKDKRALYDNGKKLLLDADYFEIGLDHFAQKDSFLYKSFIGKKLKRNFMGYVDDKNDVLIALGVTSISDSGLSFAQNEKENQDYYKRLDNNELPIMKGHVLSEEERLLNALIQSLMCQREFDLQKLKDKDYYEHSTELLNEMQEDGILEIKNGKVLVTDNGLPFLRNVAMSIDKNLINPQKLKVKFSQTI
jgi:oxygen-independent coproporphyrinogen-3 oxidase